MSAESPKPNWDGIVEQIFMVKLDKAREAQTKAAELARMREGSAARSILEAQERKTHAAAGIANRWALLESLRVRELLENLNASQNVWRGLGTIGRDQFTEGYFSLESPPTAENTTVEYSLSAPIIELGMDRGNR